MFGMYIIPNTTITFNALMIVLLYIMIIPSIISDRITLLDKDYIPYFLAISINSLLAIIFEHNANTTLIFFSVCQYMCYIIMLMCFNAKYFDIFKSYKMIIVGSDIASIYLIIQEVLALVGIYLPAGIPFLHASNPVIQSYTNNSWMSFNFYRPRSLFTEPAMFATYILLGISIYYSVNEYSRSSGIKYYLRMILYLLSLIICRSALGYMGLIFLIIIFIIKKTIGRNRHIRKQFVAIFPLLIITCIYIIRTPFVSEQLNRLNNIGSEDRFQIISNLEVLDIRTYYSMLFGHDFALSTYKSNIFLPSFFRQFYCFGITGLISLVILLVNKFLHSNIMQRLILALFIVLMLGSELLHGPMFLLYFCWLSPVTKENNIQYYDSFRDRES